MSCQCDTRPAQAAVVPSMPGTGAHRGSPYQRAATPLQRGQHLAVVVACCRVCVQPVERIRICRSVGTARGRAASAAINSTSTIIGVGMNYWTNLEKLGVTECPASMVGFPRPRVAIIGHGDEMVNQAITD